MEPKYLRKILNSLDKYFRYTLSIKRKIKSKELKVFSYQMYTMISSGINIFEAIDILESSYTNYFAKVLHELKRGLSSGKSLSESFLMTNSFSNFFINMIYSGETSGNIDLVFMEMSKYYERENKLRKKIVEAMIYPIMLMVIGLIAFNFIMVFVIPSFEEILSANPSSQNIKERWIFVFSRFLRENFVVFYAFIALLAIILYIVFKNIRDVDYYVEKLLFDISFTRKWMQIIVIERFTRSLYLLMKSGVRIEDSLEISVRVVDMVYFDRCMRPVSLSISMGRDISGAISMSGIFPKMCIDMIKIGERTGRLSNSLDSINTYYSQELDSAIDTMIKLIEPIMILVFGIVIGVVVISIISPMYDMMSTLGV